MNNNHVWTSGAATFFLSLVLGGLLCAVLVSHPMGMIGPFLFVLLTGTSQLFLVTGLAFSLFFVFCVLCHHLTKSKFRSWSVRLAVVALYSMVSLGTANVLLGISGC